MKKVLVTGANGHIGRCITEHLRGTGEYEVIATSRTPNTDLKIHRLDVSDFESVKTMAQGVDVIVHMAWAMGWYHNMDMEEMIPTTIIGTRNIYEAARINGVKRVIFGSTNHVMGFYRYADVINNDSPYRPDSMYGLTKCFAELTGRMYSDKYGISAINIRIGHFKWKDEIDTVRSARIWISSGDMADLVKCCIDAREDIKFLNLFGVSGNTINNTYDVSYLEELIGYKPKDNSDMYKDLWSKTRPEDQRDHSEYLGGQQFVNL